MDGSRNQFNPDNHQLCPDSYSQGYQFYQSQPQPIGISLPFLKSFIGWATFRAIMDIITGSLTCLGVITAIYGVPQIISGVRLLNAIDELKVYVSTNDTVRISDSLNYLNKYFKLNGIATILRIAFSIVMIIVYIVVIANLISGFGEIFPVPGFDGYQFSS